MLSRMLPAISPIRSIWRQLCAGPRRARPACGWHANGRSRRSSRCPPTSQPEGAWPWCGACIVSSPRMRTIRTTWSTVLAASPSRKALRVRASASSLWPAFLLARPARPICCASPTSDHRRRPTKDRDTPLSMPWPGLFRPLYPKSDIAAFNLFLQGLHEIGNAFHSRIDGERAAVNIKRVLVVADILQDQAKSCQRAEMARFALEHLADIGQCAAIVFLHVEDGSPPVPALNIIRLYLHDRVEQRNRKIKVLRLDSGLHAHH